MKTKVPPKISLLVILAGLPLLAETIYTPTLPDIAHSFMVPDSWVEYTLTLYLFGFALGTLFWGKLSDRFGRKPCMLAGYAIFSLGCLGCYLSSSIGLLLASRTVQAFGGSVASVIGQAISRDSFQGAALGRAYSTIAGVLAFTPAIGPVIGGLLDQALGWSSIFLLMLALSLIVWASAFLFLAETHHPEARTPQSVKTVFRQLCRDKKVLSFGMLVACANGCTFSYYAEGSFYMIDLLGLSPFQYGLTFVAIAATGLTGGYISRWLQGTFSPLTILKIGCSVSLFGSFLFALMILTATWFSLSPQAIALLTILCMMVINLGNYTVIPNALTLALLDYSHAIGTASSLFGFYYYALISTATLIMGLLHNETLYPLPIYLFGLGAVMLITSRTLQRPATLPQKAV